MRKQYIEVPLQIESSIIRKIWRRLVGAFLAPIYLIAAMILGTPGTRIHLKCAFLAVRLFLLRRISLSHCYSLIFFPMDSTRYFEFHEVLKRLEHVSFNKILDVSSPRILPLMLLMQNKEAVLDMINPDSQDTQISQRFAAALGLSARCSFTNSSFGLSILHGIASGSLGLSDKGTNNGYLIFKYPALVRYWILEN